MSNYSELSIEIVGWLSTFLFLISIIVKERSRLHELGMLTSVLTGVYAYHYGATAIWVKWIMAFCFHLYMWIKLRELRTETIGSIN